MTQNDSLSTRIITARQARGWSQKELAAILIAYGIMSQQNLSSIERGDTQRTTRLIDLAWVLGVNPLWLSTGEGVMAAESDHPLQHMTARLAPLVAKIDAMDKRGKMTPELINAIETVLLAFDHATGSATEDIGS